MYNDEDITYGSRYAKTNKALVEAMVENYEESIKPEKKSKHRIPFEEEALDVLTKSATRDSSMDHYHSYCETVRTYFTTEALYKLMSESVDEYTRNDVTNASIMRAIISQYVNENGYDNILNRMKTASISMSCMYNVIAEACDNAVKCANCEDPSTFVITPEMKDDFFKQLDYNNSEAITDAIRARVGDAMDDFVTANKKDHDDIAAALQQAQEKIDANPENAEDEELKEYYTMQAKRESTKIRNRPKSVLHSMVSAMCESVLKNKDMHDEFMTEGRLNIEKIVNRTKLMYTFMEMLNTSRLENVNSVFIESMISDLSK